MGGGGGEPTDIAQKKQSWLFAKIVACVGKAKKRSSRSYPTWVSILECFVSMEKRNSEVVQN